MGPASRAPSSPFASHTANLPRYPWGPHSRGCYELWYGKLVRARPDGTGALWFRYVLECDAPGAAPHASCWATWFDGRMDRPPLHLRTSVEVPRVDPDAPRFRVELSPSDRFLFDAETGRYHATGDVRGEAGALAWDLTWVPVAPPFHYLGAEALARWVAPSGACTPAPHALVGGTLRIDAGGGEEVLEVRTAPGMQGHIWGTRKAHAWAWAHGNDFVDAGTGKPADAAFEVLCVERTPEARPLTTMYLWLDGETHVFNRLQDLVPHRRWLLGGARVGNRVIRGARRIDLEHHGEPAITGSFELIPRETVTVEYLDTDGSRLRNRNGTLARAEVTVETARGRRRLVSERTATLELVDRP